MRAGRGPRGRGTERERSEAAGVVALFTQTYPPDSAAVGQYYRDLARALHQRGHRVRVHTASAGYNDPGARYPRREVRDGVAVRRLLLSSFGKSTYAARVAGVLGFSIQACLAMLFSRSFRVVVFGTSPPFVGLLVGWAARLRGVPTVYWAADITPEQLFGLGKVGRRSLLGRIVTAADRFIVRGADCVVVHDRFMAETVRGRGSRVAVEIVPPWPILESRRREGRGSAFRARVGLGEARVVMYSGNHSPSNPLGTLLRAIDSVQDEVDLRFVFIGDGAEKRSVEEYAARNRHGQIVSLPYQPLEELEDVLAAGDVHVVSLGSEMVGVIHPSKVYTTLAVGRPILYLGPSPSHVADLLEGRRIGWGVEHGDVARGATVLREVAGADPACLAKMGRAARELTEDTFSRDRLLGRMCAIIEDMVAR